MNEPELELAEINTQILIVKVMIAAAWSDGEVEARERKLLEQMIDKLRLSQSRKASLLLETEYKPSDEHVNAILEELCQRARTHEMRKAIIALADKMIAADKKMDTAEVDFRERLEKTLQKNGVNFFSTLKDYIKGN